VNSISYGKSYIGGTGLIKQELVFKEGF
jgi:hypothetical protein